MRFLLACSGATGGGAGSSPSSGSSATSAAVAGKGLTAPLAFSSFAASRAKALQQATQTQHGTERLHSSAVSPCSVRQGLQLGQQKMHCDKVHSVMQTWIAWDNTWLLKKLTLKGILLFWFILLCHAQVQCLTSSCMHRGHDAVSMWWQAFVVDAV